MEFVRMLNYLLRFGLFIYRDNEFKINDIDLIFSYLCFVCDIFTKKSDIKSIYSLDKIISKDNILSDISKLDPIQRSTHDIKYTLFNKNYGDRDNRRKDFFDYGDKVNSKYFYTKILIEITTIFHLFNDLRQHYLMSNNVEFFYNISSQYREGDSKKLTKEKCEEIKNELIKEFKNLIPDSTSFNNHMVYELQSIDTMYEKDDLKHFRSMIDNDDNMHEEFVTLVINIFNLHNYDPFLRQLIILLICRYHSERAEFIRNLDRMILFFDDSDWKFYQWVINQLDKFVFYSEKSYIWLLKIKNMIIDSGNDIEEVQVNDELDELMEILDNLKRALVYELDITFDENGISLEFKKGERLTNSFAQNLYRNTKVYDYLINFLFQNKELLLKVRKLNMDTVSEGKKEIVRLIRKVFKRIFRILEKMTENNNKTQDLMWKYKEDFIFEELGSSEQEGELELVLVIIDDSEKAIKFNQNKYTLSKTR